MSRLMSSIPDTNNNPKGGLRLIAMMKKAAPSIEFAKSKQMKGLADFTMETLGPNMILVPGQYLNK